MLRAPKQPISPGRANEHARRTAAHIQQRGASMAGGSTTTKGFIPNRPKQIIQRGGGGDTIVAAPLSMVFRGEHSNGANYNPGDTVKVMGGDNGGGFVATVPIPAGSSEEPGAGSSWDQFSSFTFGQWT